MFITIHSTPPGDQKTTNRQVRSRVRETKRTRGVSESHTKKTRDGEPVPEAGEAVRGDEAGLPAGALRLHRLQDGASRPCLGCRHRQRPGHPAAGEAVQGRGGHGHERAAAVLRAAPPQRALRPHAAGPPPRRHPRRRRAAGLRRPRHRGAGLPLARPAALLRAGPLRPARAAAAAGCRGARRLVLHRALRRRRRGRRLLAPLQRVAAVLGAQPAAGRRQVQRRGLPLRPRRRRGTHGPVRVLDGAAHGPRRLPRLHHVVVGVPDGQGEGRRAARRGDGARVRRRVGRRQGGGEDGEVSNLPQDRQGEAREVGECVSKRGEIKLDRLGRTCFV